MEQEEEHNSTGMAGRLEHGSFPFTDKEPQCPQHLQDRRNEHGDDGGRVGRAESITVDLEDLDDVDHHLPLAIAPLYPRHRTHARVRHDEDQPENDRSEEGKAGVSRTQRGLVYLLGHVVVLLSE